MGLGSLLTAYQKATFFESRCLELEEKFAAEIERNRCREDQLLNAVIAAASGNRLIHPPVVRESDSARTDQIAEEQPRHSSIQDREIEEVMAGFIQQAAQNGYVYSDDDIRELRNSIASNPGEYIS